MEKMSDELQGDALRLGQPRSVQAVRSTGRAQIS
jgi:hypothetical protein